VIKSNNLMVRRTELEDRGTEPMAFGPICAWLCCALLCTKKVRAAISKACSWHKAIQPEAVAFDVPSLGEACLPADGTGG
jgi:hypothetical protein